jgi:hypothetical protein
MAKPDPAVNIARELQLLLRSYPEVSLADLGRALAPAPVSSPSAGVDPSWASSVEPILRCAQGFGDPRLFSSKRQALQVLSDELNVPASWTNLQWNQLPSIAAAALLQFGPDKAHELIHRYQLGSARARAPRRNSRADSTVSTTLGIIQAKHT